MNLRRRLELWVASYALGRAFDRFPAKEIADRMESWLDGQFGTERSQDMQVKLCDWLDAVTKSLRDV